MINWKLKTLLSILLVIAISGNLLGQVKVSRQVVDSATHAPIAYADISVRGKTINTILSTDASGRFETITRDSALMVVISASGYGFFNYRINPYSDTNTIILIPKKLVNLREVTVSANFNGIRFRKDTTEFTADSIPQRYSADVLELLSLIPGLSFANGTMVYNGEPIEYIQVEGNEYNATTIIPFLKSIQAKNIEKIQIIDRARQQLTVGPVKPGNGTRENILNITLKTEAKSKILGDAMVGVGTDSRLTGKFSANKFQEKEQFMLAGKYDNTNGVVDGNTPGAGENKQGEFNGNYSRNLDKNNKLGINIKYNQTSQQQQRDVLRNQVLPTGLLTSQSSDSTKIDNKKFSLNLQSDNRISKAILSRTFGGFSTADGTSSQLNQFQYLNAGAITSSGRTSQYDRPKERSASITNNLFIDLPGKGGSLIFALNYEGKNANHNNEYFSDIISNISDSLPPKEDIVRRRNPVSQQERSFNWAIIYNVNLSSKIALSYSQTGAIGKETQTFNTFDNLEPGGDSWKLNDSLSADIVSRDVSSISYLSAALKLKNADISAGSGFIYRHLTGHTLQDTATNNMANFLPFISFNLRPNKESAFKLDIQTSFAPLSASQLLAVTDYSNPLQVTASNKNLRNETGVKYTLSYNYLFRKSLANLFARFEMYNGKNKITTDMSYDSLGRQYSHPINMDGYNTYNFNLDYSRFLFNKKLNIGISSNMLWSQTPIRLNGVETNVKATTINGSLRLNYLPAKSLKIGANVGGNINKSIYGGTDNTTNMKSMNFQGLVQFESKSGFTANATYTQIINFGLPPGLNASPEILNMSVGKKIIKGKAEVNLHVFDLLNKYNTNTRTTGIGYIEDSRTNSIQRFVMGSFTWYFGN
ncbi:outer membrane beta-barrel protein [Chitinophaga sp. Hz27]|uniref:outer membrane beta-barrel protein n=1 Tax=Chitinophaga sp. Hz27 TaxID=3347169 RepID=UPI0035E162BD